MLSVTCLHSNAALIRQFIQETNKPASSIRHLEKSSSRRAVGQRDPSLNDTLAQALFDTAKTHSTQQRPISTPHAGVDTPQQGRDVRACSTVATTKKAEIMEVDDEIEAQSGPDTPGGPLDRCNTRTCYRELIALGDQRHDVLSAGATGSRPVELHGGLSRTGTARRTRRAQRLQNSRHSKFSQGSLSRYSSLLIMLGCFATLETVRGERRMRRPCNPRRRRWKIFWTASTELWSLLRGS